MFHNSNIKILQYRNGHCGYAIQDISAKSRYSQNSVLSVAAAEAEAVICKAKDYDDCNDNPDPSIGAAVIASAAASEIAGRYVGHIIKHLRLLVVAAAGSGSPEQEKEKNDEPKYGVVSVATVEISS